GGLRVAEAITVVRDVVEHTLGRDTLRKSLGDLVVRRRPGRVVAPLDEEPRLSGVATLAPSNPDEVPAPAKLLAVQHELELSLRQPRTGIADRLPGASIPQQHGAAAVLSLGDDALESAVFHRMILGAHRKTLRAGVEARSLGDGPADQDAVQLQAEVVVQARRGVLLHHERVPSP